MKNAISKSLVLAIALAVAVGGVLFFVRYIVSPPESISAMATSKDVFQPDLENVVKQYEPSEVNLKDAEVALDAIVDRAYLYWGDSLITDYSIIDKIKTQSANKFAKFFHSWAINKFEQNIWYTSDHATMLRLSNKLEKMGVNDVNRKSLYEIENVISNYNRAWHICKNSVFVSYENTSNAVKEANSYKNEKYLTNCTNLKNALSAVGRNLEKSRYNQLYNEVDKLGKLENFRYESDYKEESSRIGKLVEDFKKSKAFGVSTETDATILAEKQDRYDKSARYYY